MPVTHGVAGSSPVQTAKRKKERKLSSIVLKNIENNFGLVVQLVRIHACHAWGRGFESRPDRQIISPFFNRSLTHYKKILDLLIQQGEYPFLGESLA